MDDSVRYFKVPKFDLSQSSIFHPPVKSHFCIEGNLISSTDKAESLATIMDARVLVSRCDSISLALLAGRNILTAATTR